MSGHDIVELFRMLVDYAAMGIELLAVLVIVTAVIVVAVSRGTVRHVFTVGKPGAYESYKCHFSKALLLGLDLLVAGDLIKTVALEPNLTDLESLALLVMVRTFLSWSLVVEIEGHWPWKKGASQDLDGGAGQTGGNIV